MGESSTLLGLEFDRFTMPEEHLAASALTATEENEE